jgi:hypothetical protein
MINIYYNGKDRNELEKQVLLAAKEVAIFFDKSPEKIDIKIHKTRKEFDKECQQRSREWVVANANNGRINILHPDAFEKESSHPREEFLLVLKHEFTHIFLELLSSGHMIPRWLNEGLANHIADLKRPQDNLFIEENFCKKLGTSKGWDENVNYFAYQTAQLFVSFLVKKFSVKKVIKLISGLEKNYYYESFNKSFTKLMGKSLEEVESEFIKELNTIK